MVVASHIKSGKMSYWVCPNCGEASIDYSWGCEVGVVLGDLPKMFSVSCPRCFEKCSMNAIRVKGDENGTRK